SNIKIIFKLMRSVAHLPGDMAECGVYQGATLIAEALYLKQNKIPRSICACDSFEGFDETVLSEIALGGTNESHKRIGGFDDTSVRLIQNKLSRLELNDRVHLLKGYFQNSLSELKDRRFCF